MADNIFGLEDPENVDESVFENDPAPEEAAEEAEPEAPAAEDDGTPEVVEEPAPPLGDDTVVEEPPVDIPELLASDPSLNKFKSYEALAEGYKNAMALHNRTAVRARDAEKSAAEWQAAANQAMQMLQSRQAPAQGIPEDLKRLADEAGVDENTLRIAQALAQRSAQAETQTVQQQLMQNQQQQQQLQAQQTLQATVQGFFAAHPEVIQGSETDTRLGNLVGELDLDPSNPDALEAAYELVQDPDLELYVRANPHLVDTEAGMAHARNQVALNKRLSSAASAHTTAQQEAGRQAALRKAAVETGGGTPPTSPGGETDEWAQVLAVARADRSDDNIYGLPGS